MKKRLRHLLKSNKTKKFRPSLFALIALGALGVANGKIYANPLPTLPNTNGNGFIVGSGSIVTDTANKKMTITQDHHRGKIDWKTFDIASKHTVEFKQPSSQSITLNQVLGSSQSAINGAMQANGQVILINPNGVTFGSGSSINAAGFIASTLGITEENFKQFASKNTPNLVFTGGKQAGNIVNAGNLAVNGSNGYIALIAPNITNESGGKISAMGGPMNTVSLASGDGVTLTFNDNSKGNMLVGVSLDSATLNGLIQNFGMITVNNGSAMVMSAQALRATMGAMINNEGMPTVDTMSNNAGTIILQAKNIINGPGGSITADSFSGKYITNQYHADHDDDGHHHHHHNGPQISGVAVGGKVDITAGDGLINLGRISANATAVGVNSGARDAGVGIDRSGTQIAGVAKGGKVDIKTKDGGVINTGKISADATAIGVNTGARDAGVGIDRSGTQIAGVASGGKVDITTNGGGVINTGKITANAAAGGVNIGPRDKGLGVDISGPQVAGVAAGDNINVTTNGADIINAGKITANAAAGGVNTGAKDVGLGIDRSGSQVAGVAKGGAVDINTTGGGVINFGAISANATAGGVNTGAQDTGIGGDRSGAQVAGVASGGTVDIKTKDGGVINAGKITADAAAGAVNTGPRDIGIGVDISGPQVAGVAKGGKVDIATNGGGVINAGKISANAAAGGVNTGPRDTGIGVNISGPQVAGVAAGGNVDITTNGGGVINTGKITANAAAGGVNTGARDAGIGIDRSGTQIAGVAKGGTVDINTTGGGVINTGKISANATGSTSKGGTVDLTGQNIALTSNSTVSAVGETTGGSVFFQYTNPVEYKQSENPNLNNTPTSWQAGATVATDPKIKGEQSTYNKFGYGSDIWVIGELQSSANENYQIGTLLIKSPASTKPLTPIVAPTVPQTGIVVPQTPIASPETGLNPSIPTPSSVTPAQKQLASSARFDDGGLNCIIFIGRDGTLNNECEARNR